MDRNTVRLMRRMGVRTAALLIAAGLSMGQSCAVAPGNSPPPASGDQGNGGDEGQGGSNTTSNGVSFLQCPSTLTSGAQQQLQLSDATNVVNWGFTLSGAGGSITIKRPSDQEIIGQLSASSSTSSSSATISSQEVGGSAILLQAQGAGLIVRIAANGAAGELATCTIQVQ